MSAFFPSTLQEIVSLRDNPTDSETVMKAIAGVIHVARSQGQSLEELTAEVLHDDCFLDLHQRRQLKDWVIRVWQAFPEAS